MCNYSITLRNIEEFITHNDLLSFFTDYNINDFLTNKQIQTITNSGLWSKEKLAEKIIEHYYFREIGFETIALFKHYAKITMKEIMESKLPLIYSKCIEFDPLINVDYTEEFNRTIEGTAQNNGSLSGTSQNTGSSSSTSQSSSNSTSNHTTKNLDTPENEISNLENNKYLSSANITNDTSNLTDNTTNSSQNTANNTTSQTSQNQQNSNNIEHYVKTQKGNSGSLTTAQNLIQQYRDIIISIDNDIIKELNSLFMGIY